MAVEFGGTCANDKSTSVVAVVNFDFGDMNKSFGWARVVGTFNDLPVNYQIVVDFCCFSLRALAFSREYVPLGLLIEKIKTPYHQKKGSHTLTLAGKI